MHVLRLHEVLGIAWSLTTLAFIFTIGRFAIHWHRRRRLAWDDFFNGVAMLFCIAFTVTYHLIAPTEYNAQLAAMGIIDESEVKESDPHRNARLNAANSLIFWCVIYAVKASFLALYWHVFSEISLKFRIAWAFAAVFTFISFGVTLMWGFWLCGHPKYFPDTQPQCHENAPGRVLPMLEAWLALDLAGDVLLIALPCTMLKPLLMKTSQKIELAIIFCLVVVNMVLTILRTVYSIDVDLMKFPDQNVLWYFLQVTITVIVCALPCYRGMLCRKRNGSLRHLERFGSGSSEFAEIWQRYLVSVGEHSQESRQREMEQSKTSQSTSTKSIPPRVPPGTAV
ncbi:hypothetical protein K458DRAFT_340881 [Lentithecium fluviatile CBS 122367]|uniref:Rhodopsin domain-containing protein n=1 Tax=Lentithecium fluviatile CBS 122367 TaxID=1168545 RepID=A0A6G1IXL8_9PLEO|nr:hypothetical protein K458DRAFT_340881 [Lentithecium fluviatile CBS 122367]